MSALLIQSNAAEELLPERTALQDEMDLVRAAQSDPEAMSTLYRQHYPAIARHVYRRVGRQDLADDLVADVFLSMVKYLPRYRVGSTPFRAWLYRLATNRVNRWARWQRRRAWRTLQDPASERNEQARRDESAHVRAALLTLPLPYQTVIALHYLEAMPVEEIAMVAGCAVGTVKSRLARGRALLRPLLSESDGE